MNSIVGEGSSITNVGAHDNEKVVSHKNWRIQVILNGSRFGKFVAEVCDGHRHCSYILKTYVEKSSAMAEHLVLSRISIENPHLVLAKEWFYYDDRYYFIYECEDVDFFTILSRPMFKDMYKDGKHLTYFRQALLAVRFLHTNDLIHYDIKFENMVMNIKTKQLRLIDFECCTDWNTRKKKQGTMPYMAPEIYLANTVKQYDPGKQDVWSLAVLIMFLLFPQTQLITTDARVLNDYHTWIHLVLPKDHFLLPGLSTLPIKRCDIDDLIQMYDRHVIGIKTIVKTSRVE
jgi:serine/threonine protein kinase